MSPHKIIAILLLAGGAVALIFGGFSFTRETHDLDVGSMHISVDEKQHVNIPVWAGAGALLVGGLLLVLRRGD
jgi:hypothetical protein